MAGVFSSSWVGERLSQVGNCAWGRLQDPLKGTLLGPRQLDGRSTSAREAQLLCVQVQSGGKRHSSLFSSIPSWCSAPEGWGPGRQLGGPSPHWNTPPPTRFERQERRWPTPPSPPWRLPLESREGRWLGHQTWDEDFQLCLIDLTQLKIIWNLVVHPSVISGMGFKNFNILRLGGDIGEKLNSLMALRTFSTFITYMCIYMYVYHCTYHVCHYMKGRRILFLGQSEKHSRCWRGMPRWHGMRMTEQINTQSGMKRIHLKSFGLLSIMHIFAS